MMRTRTDPGRLCYQLTAGSDNRALASGVAICIDIHNARPKSLRPRRINRRGIDYGRITMSLAKIFLGVATAAVLSIGTAAAQTEVKLGHVGAPGSLFDLTSQEFAKRANSKLG